MLGTIESTDPVHALVCGGDLESPRSHPYPLVAAAI
jgi:hypothetical protein